jgi:hypothetical protein
MYNVYLPSFPLVSKSANEKEAESGKNSPKKGMI